MSRTRPMSLNDSTAQRGKKDKIHGYKWSYSLDIIYSGKPYYAGHHRSPNVEEFDFFIFLSH